MTSPSRRASPCHLPSVLSPTPFPCGAWSVEPAEHSLGGRRRRPRSSGRCPIQRRRTDLPAHGDTGRRQRSATGSARQSGIIRCIRGHRPATYGGAKSSPDRPPTPDRGIRGGGRNLSTSGGFLSRPGASPRVSDSRRRSRTARHAAQPGYVTRAPTSPGGHRPGQTGVFHSHSTRTKLATGVFHSQSRDVRHGHPGYVTRDRTGV